MQKICTGIARAVAGISPFVLVKPVSNPLKFRPFHHSGSLKHAFPQCPFPARQPQCRTACRCNLSATVRTDSGRRRQRQNPRADHAHRMAAAKPNGQRAQHSGRNVYQQSRQRNAGAAGGDAAVQPTRHVAGDIPRAVPPLLAAAPPRSRHGTGISNFG